MKLEIELRPHVGKQVVPGLGEVDVEFDQYMIFVTGAEYTAATGIKALHVGYVAKSPVNNCPRTGQSLKNPVNWLPIVNQWPPAVVDALSRSVQSALAATSDASQVDKDLAAAGDTRPVNVPPPVLPEPAPSASAEQASAADDNNL